MEEKMDTAKKIRLLAEILEVDTTEIKADFRLDGYPTWDSMAVLSLMDLLEEHFGRSDVDGSQIRNMKKVEDVFKLMEKQHE
jgi:acyl carrier protein